MFDLYDSKIFFAKWRVTNIIVQIVPKKIENGVMKRRDHGSGSDNNRSYH